MSKLSDQFLDNVYLDSKGLSKVKNFVQDRKTRVVFLPMYKSFTDPLVMFFVTYFCNLELGFSFYNNEDYPDVKFAEYLYKKTGLIMTKREDLQNLYINYVNQCLVQDVIENNPITTIYQNDYRLRSGKFNDP